jgi:hypothetical protein
MENYKNKEITKKTRKRRNCEKLEIAKIEKQRKEITKTRN